MRLLYFLQTVNFNEKLKQNYIWQNLHKREGERNMKEINKVYDDFIGNY